MPQEYITLNGIKTFVLYENLSNVNWEETKDDPEKIPFVIQHGHTANHYFMKPIFDYFSEKGWPVVSFDWRGHGWSEKNIKDKYKMDDCVEDLHEFYLDFLKKKFGYEKFTLLGHSMGGFIALKYAIKYQETLNRLIPLSTTPCLVSNFFVRGLMKIGIKIWDWKYDYFFNKKKNGHIQLGIENFPHWEDTTLMPDPRATIEFMDDMRHYDIRKQLETIKIPTHVWVGSEDGFMNPSKLIADSIPNADVDVMHGYVHNIQIQAKDILSEQIYEYLKNGFKTD